MRLAELLNKAPDPSPRVDVMHGSADEREASSKYPSCRRLVIGIVDNIRNNNEMSQAVAALGWNTGVDA